MLFLWSIYMQKEGDHIKIDGIAYIPVKRAAMLADYTADYVGQLCRAKKLEATRVGRAWYVSENSIIAHKEGQILKETPQAEVQEFDVKGEVQRVKNKITPKSIFKPASFIVYKRDDRPLLPNLMQIEPGVEDEPEISTKEPETPQDLPQTIVTRRNVEEKQGALLQSIFSYIGRTLLGVASFVIVFLLIFSLNGSYTGELIGGGLNSVVASVASTEAVKTVNTDILEPYRLSATEFSKVVDESIHTLIYGETNYDETATR